MPKAGLRDEDYVAFLDESGTGKLQVVSGVLIPVRWLRPAEHRWRAFIQTELARKPVGPNGGKEPRIVAWRRRLSACTNGDAGQWPSAPNGESGRTAVFPTSAGAHRRHRRGPGSYRCATHHPTRRGLSTVVLDGLCGPGGETECSKATTTLRRHRRRGCVVQKGAGASRVPFLSPISSMSAICRCWCKMVRRGSGPSRQQTASVCPDGRPHCWGGASRHDQQQAAKAVVRDPSSKSRGSKRARDRCLGTRPLAVEATFTNRRLR